MQASVRVMVVLGLLALAGLGWALWEVVRLFFWAALVTALLFPMVRRLDCWLGRSLAVTLVMVGLVGGTVTVVIPWVISELGRLLTIFADVPWLSLGAWGRSLLPEVVLGWLPRWESQWMGWAEEASRFVAKVSWGWLPGWLSGVQAGMGTMLMVLVLTFYGLLDAERLTAAVRAWVPPSWRRRLGPLGQDLGVRLHAYMRGQSLVCLIQGVWYSLGLCVLQLEGWLMLGLLWGLLSVIPYVGSLIGVILASLLMLAQYDGLLWSFGISWVAMVLWFAVGNVLESYVWLPHLVGASMGLHPLAMMFGLLVGYELAGIAGATLSLPALCVVAVVGEHLRGMYQRSVYYR
jgi:predicted PurR-regulated permease PerM